MIGVRLPRDLSPNAATLARQRLERQGLELLDLTESNPTRAGFTYPPDVLAPLASSRGLVYDPQPRGLASARAAVSDQFRRRGLTVPPARVALTASTSEAYALLFKLICGAGERVLVPAPSYPLFEHLTALEAVEARPYRLEYHGAWRIDLDHLSSAVDDRTRAVLVVSPNNPTGSFLHADDLVRLNEICASRELLLIGDEVFGDFPLDAAPSAVSVLAAPDAMTCSLGGLSKSVGLPQLKLAWIGFGGPQHRVDALLAAYDVVADAYLSVSTPVQVALPELLAGGTAVREQIRSRIARNLAALRAAIASVPAVSVPTVEGGWSAVLQVPAYRGEEALVLALLVEDQVVVHPGYFFDFEREAFIVVSLLVEPSRFDGGIGRVLARACSPDGDR